MHLPRPIKRLTAASTAVAALLGGVTIASSSADLSSQIQASKNTAANLRSQINAESAQIAKTAGGVAAAQQQYAAVQASLDEHIAELQTVQYKLMKAKQELISLENRLYLSTKYLAANLRAAYESGSPNLVDVVLNAHGFSGLLNQVNDMKDAQHQNAEIIRVTRIVRARTEHLALGLGKIELQDRTLTDRIRLQRNQEAVLHASLLRAEIAQEAVRSHNRARLASVDAQTAELQKKYNEVVAAAAAAAKQSAQQSALNINNQAGAPIAADSGATAPPGAPAVVQEMINAGNLIATTPYIWGGGHGSFNANGYDCSGSVSFVLHAAGLLTAPEVSGDFESYGDPGPGQWVTIYANAGHVWMQIGPWRFDTVALAEYGSRWSQGGGEYAGFVVRHPPGL
jgi:peptidoglycan hydrolase CwlO-like protein